MDALVRSAAGAATVVRVAREIEPVAVITGGSHGVGRAMARELASRGYAVVVVYMEDQAAAETTVEEILADHGTALAIRAQLSDELDVERVFRETNVAFGEADIVVHVSLGEGALFAEHAARQLARDGAFFAVRRSQPITPALSELLTALDLLVGHPEETS